MPAVFIGTMMEAKNIKWRPKFTSGLSEEGPEDKLLIIEFSGTLSNLSWVIPASYGYAIDLNALASSAPGLFGKKWLTDKGLRKADISEISHHNYLINVKL